ncbi:hypothetical protein [Picosynechococcus sp. NKBG042902]|uniref:hypothetical protein n=1 Tax=Picosynechococcus sp. NKBG042902 TaxID=490193 RepID=UPI001268E85A|nr:hypothetical protein [Picosynechococcus sp. NKBG042902]
MSEAETSDKPNIDPILAKFSSLSWSSSAIAFKVSSGLRNGSSSGALEFLPTDQTIPDQLDKRQKDVIQEDLWFLRL